MLKSSLLLFLGEKTRVFTELKLDWQIIYEFFKLLRRSITIFD